MIMRNLTIIILTILGFGAVAATIFIALALTAGLEGGSTDTGLASWRLLLEFLSRFQHPLDREIVFNGAPRFEAFDC